MVIKITLDELTQNSVSVKTQNYIDVGGVEHLIGEPHRKAYVNSVRGRVELQEEVPDPQLTAVLSVWGTTPTVEESTPL